MTLYHKIPFEYFSASLLRKLNKHSIKSNHSAVRKRAKLNLKTVVYKIFELT